MSGINDWLAVIAKEKSKDVDVVSKGWYRRSELQRLMNLSKYAVNQRLKDLLDKGLCEKKRFRIQTKERGNFPEIHYKLIKK